MLLRVNALAVLPALAKPLHCFGFRCGARAKVRASAVTPHPFNVRLALSALAALSFTACAEQVPEPSRSAWETRVQVAGQPDAVPAEWVSTREGNFAHSIKIPNPVPKDSGYRKGMTSREYFDHLCNTQAGETIFKTIDNVEGFLLMRPPRRPTDRDLQDRYKLEAPEIERLFQLMRDTPEARATLFINPPWGLYRFIEEPSSKGYVKSYGYRQRQMPMKKITSDHRASAFGLTWRGVRRKHDRDLSISGGEWIVLNLQTNEVLAVSRTFGLSPEARGVPQGIWWLNATPCSRRSKAGSVADNSLELYHFVSRVLTPMKDVR